MKTKKIVPLSQLGIQQQSSDATADFLQALRQAGISVEHRYDSIQCESSHPEHTTKGMIHAIKGFEEAGFVQARQAPFLPNNHRMLKRPATQNQSECVVLITTKFTPIHAGYEITNGSMESIKTELNKIFHASSFFTICWVHQYFTRLVDNNPLCKPEFMLLKHRNRSFFMLIDWFGLFPLWEEDVVSQ